MRDKLLIFIRFYIQYTQLGSMVRLILMTMTTTTTSFHALMHSNLILINHIVSMASIICSMYFA